MQHPHPATPGGRDRSLRRVRRLTLGAAVGSLAAVVGLGSVAAATNPGKTTEKTTGKAASAPAATGTGSTVTPTPTATPTPTPTATPGQSTGDSGLQQAPSAPSAGTGGSASATSGGS